MASNKVRVRIAPSPTGNLHLGTARTALYNFLYARHHGGAFVLRLEDTDAVRSNEVFTVDIMDGLHWLGLTWDEGPDIGGPFAPYRQTEKLDHYNQIALELLSAGKAYYCFCSTEDLTEMKDAQKTSGVAARYDNRCRHLSAEEANEKRSQGIQPVIRFKIEEPFLIEWQDDIKGKIEISASDLGGDMVMVKSSGHATFNFAVVVDDVDMEITHVIRGEDHIHNTAKQILVYQALGKGTPQFGHVPLIFDLERHKLSKRRHGEAVHIDQYRKDGYLQEALVNYLTQMSWTAPDGREVYTVEEACRMFDMDKVSKSPAVFDIQRLKWFNSHYIKSLPLSSVTDRALPFLSHYKPELYERKQLERIVESVREGLETLGQINEATLFYFEDKISLAPDLQNSTLSSESAQKVLSEFHKHIEELPFDNAAGCKAIVDQVGKSLSIKGKELYWPLRAALSGKTHGPDLGSIIGILGPQRVRSRIEAAMQPCLSP